MLGVWLLAITVYKPGQGYWTRVFSAVGAGILVLAVGAWLWNELEVVRGEYAGYIQAGVVVTWVLACAAVLWRVMNKPRVADFMIATDTEMNKVNWPSRREIVISTWIVICGTVMLAALLFVVDAGFALLFQLIGILESG